MGTSEAGWTVIPDPWRELLAEPLSRDHVVQVYRDDRVLVAAVSLYASAALGRHEAVILVATGEHGRAVAERLASEGFDVELLKAWGQLSILDAREVLSRLMVGGAPNEERFKALVAEVIGAAKASRRFRDVRVYGEMVNLLWSQQDLASARRLEELWNDVIEQHSISLFCAYCLDAGGGPERVFPPDLRRLHTHLIPVESGA